MIPRFGSASFRSTRSELRCASKLGHWNLACFKHMLKTKSNGEGANIKLLETSSLKIYLNIKKVELRLFFERPEHQLQTPKKKCQ